MQATTATTAQHTRHTLCGTNVTRTTSTRTRATTLATSKQPFSIELMSFFLIRLFTELRSGVHLIHQNEMLLVVLIVRDRLIVLFALGPIFVCVVGNMLMINYI